MDASEAGLKNARGYHRPLGAWALHSRAAPDRLTRFSDAGLVEPSARGGGDEAARPLSADVCGLSRERFRAAGQHRGLPARGVGAQPAGERPAADAGRGARADDGQDAPLSERARTRAPAGAALSGPCREDPRSPGFCIAAAPAPSCSRARFRAGRRSTWSASPPGRSASPSRLSSQRVLRVASCVSACWCCCPRPCGSGREDRAAGRRRGLLAPPAGGPGRCPAADPGPGPFVRGRRRGTGPGSGAPRVAGR